jgi:hypothetical protein
VRPDAYRDSTAWIATYIAGVLNVSNMICNHMFFIDEKDKYSNYRL